MYVVTMRSMWKGFISPPPPPSDWMCIIYNELYIP